MNFVNISGYRKISRIVGRARSRRGPPGESMLLGRPVLHRFRSLGRIASRRVAGMRRVVLDRMAAVMVVVMMVMRHGGGGRRIRRGGGGGASRGSGVVGKSDNGSKHQRRREADRRK